jgi:hypothetical protein
MGDDMTTDILLRLQYWYVSACNGDWEHQNGVLVESLDNPGWLVTIDLAGTTLESETFQEVSDLTPKVDWVRCWVEGGKFRGAGGPLMLGRIFDIFLGWAEPHDRPRQHPDA